VIAPAPESSSVIHTPGKRRMWQIDPEVIAAVTSSLLSSDDVEVLLDAFGLVDSGRPQAKESALRIRMLLACTAPCALAAAVERILDDRTEIRSASVAGGPLSEAADWPALAWRIALKAHDPAGVLWRLSRERPGGGRLTGAGTQREP